jgi:hypothetical protein
VDKVSSGQPTPTARTRTRKRKIISDRGNRDRYGVKSLGRAIHVKAAAPWCGVRAGRGSEVPSIDMDEEHP